MHPDNVSALCGVDVGLHKDGSLDITHAEKARVTCWRCINLLFARPLPTEPPTPEHDRLDAAKKTDDATQLVGEFVDWLREEGIVLAKWTSDEELVPAQEPVVKLLAEFFEVSEVALESEKRALLEHLRAVTRAREWAEKEGRAALCRD